jgi:hypothetical protein
MAKKVFDDNLTALQIVIQTLQGVKIDLGKVYKDLKDDSDLIEVSEKQSSDVIKEQLKLKKEALESRPHRGKEK